AANYQSPIGVQLEQARAQALNQPGAILQAARDERAAAYKALKSGKLSIQAMIDAWNAIGEANQQLQQQLDPLASLVQVSSKRLTGIPARGTGLDAAGRRRLGYNIAGAEIQPLHVHVNIDGREIGSV